MNWQHLQTFLWLRWRLFVNQSNRGGGVVTAVLTLVAAVLVVAMAVPLFVGCALLGAFGLQEAAPPHLLYIWDGLVVAFLFFWGIGLMTELQRTEVLSLSKFLHLPVSVQGAFAVNYVSSLLRLSTILFVPAMLGLGLGLAWSHGWRLLAALPLTAAFLLMVTALTYQFQGWLASLMSNPRRRRNIVFAMTAIFVLVVQLPSLLNLFGYARGQGFAESLSQRAEDLAALEKSFHSQEIDATEHSRRTKEVLDRFESAHRRAAHESEAHWERTARALNMSLPIGWLPLGTMAAAEGTLLPAALGLLGMTLIGAASLRRAYRTTLRLYLGQFTSPKAKPARAVASAAPNDKTKVSLLERRLPWLSEPVAAIALGGFRSLIRAPEAKMMLLTPIIMAAVFGTMLVKGSQNVDEMLRPLTAFGAMTLVLFGVLQIMSNQFGFDRDGFRVYVLCAASRRDILLGKNLAFAPLAMGLAAVMLAALQAASPLRWDHLLATVPQFVMMYLLFCLLANLISICAPVPIAAGSLKPANPKLLAMVVQMAMFFCLFPFTAAPALLPLGAEAALDAMGLTANVPVCLLLSVLECIAAAFFYRTALGWQGGLLASREQRILEIVTNRAA